MNIKNIILIERSKYSTNYHVLSISQTSRNCDFGGQVGDVYFLAVLEIDVYIYMCVCAHIYTSQVAQR